MGMRDRHEKEIRTCRKKGQNISQEFPPERVMKTGHLW